MALILQHEPMHSTDPEAYAYGMWLVVVFNIVLILFFVVSFIKPTKRFEWTSMGDFIAFIVALFSEMYGVPLTIYLLTTWLGEAYPVLDPFSHRSGHLVLVFIGLAHSGIAMTLLHVVSNGILLFGFYLLWKGWSLIHAARGEHLVTEGVYARICHPQYVGMFLVTVAFLIQWPSLTTLIMWPILVLAYWRLARRKEKELEKRFGREFIEYRYRVPAVVPSFVRSNAGERMST